MKRQLLLAVGTSALCCSPLFAQTGMHGGSGMMGSSMHGNMAMHGNMMSSEMLKQMKSCMSNMSHLGPADQNYDKRFLDMMIIHHQGAIDMAHDAMAKAKHPELKQMAQNIIDAQQKEIKQMEQWRLQWYGKK